MLILFILVLGIVLAVLWVGLYLLCEKFLDSAISAVIAVVMGIVISMLVLYATLTETEVACELTRTSTGIAYIDENGTVVPISSEDLKNAKIVDCDYSYCGVITEEFLGIELSKSVQVYTPIVWKEEE